MKNKLYCTKCGKQLKFTKVMLDEFDLVSGKQDFYEDFICPNRQSGVKGFFGGHTKGDTYHEYE